MISVCLPHSAFEYVRGHAEPAARSRAPTTQFRPSVETQFAPATASRAAAESVTRHSAAMAVAVVGAIRRTGPQASVSHAAGPGLSIEHAALVIKNRPELTTTGAADSRVQFVEDYVATQVLYLRSSGSWNSRPRNSMTTSRFKWRLRHRKASASRFSLRLSPWPVRRSRDRTRSATSCC